MKTIISLFFLALSVSAWGIEFNINTAAYLPIKFTEKTKTNNPNYPISKKTNHSIFWGGVFGFEVNQSIFKKAKAGLGIKFLSNIRETQRLHEFGFSFTPVYANFVYNIANINGFKCDISTNLGVSLISNKSSYYNSFDEKNAGFYGGLGYSFCKKGWQIKLDYNYYSCSFKENSTYYVKHNYMLHSMLMQLGYNF